MSLCRSVSIITGHCIPSCCLQVPLSLNSAVARVDVITVGAQTALLLSCEHAFCDGLSWGSFTHLFLSHLCETLAEGACLACSVVCVYV